MIKATDSLLLRSVREHEGFSPTPYKCPAGYLTIGYGLNLEAGISEAEAEAVLRVRLARIIETLYGRYAWFPLLSPARQRAIVEMAYQLGIEGLAKFQRMLRALREARFDAAAAEMLDSAWARQTPKRAEHCARLMREG